MSSLSFEEFNKLSEEEKSKQYKNLSNHDKFLARMAQNPGGGVIGYEKITEKEKKWAEELHKQILEENKKETWKM